eukprot:gene4481-3274_t
MSLFDLSDDEQSVSDGGSSSGNVSDLLPSVAPLTAGNSEKPNQLISCVRGRVTSVVDPPRGSDGSVFGNSIAAALEQRKRDREERERSRIQEQRMKDQEQPELVKKDNEIGIFITASYRDMLKKRQQKSEVPPCETTEDPLESFIKSLEVDVQSSNHSPEANDTPSSSPQTSAGRSLTRNGTEQKKVYFPTQFLFVLFVLLVKAYMEGEHLTVISLSHSIIIIILAPLLFSLRKKLVVARVHCCDSSLPLAFPYRIVLSFSCGGMLPLKSALVKERARNGYGTEERETVLSRFATAVLRSMKQHSAVQQPQDCNGLPTTESTSLLSFSAPSSEAVAQTEHSAEVFHTTATAPYVLSSVPRFVPLYQLAIKEIITECERRVANSPGGGPPLSADGSVSTKVFEAAPPESYTRSYDTADEGQEWPLHSGPGAWSDAAAGAARMTTPSSLMSLDSLTNGGGSSLWPRDAMQAFLANVGRHIRNQDAPLVFTAGLVYLSRIARRSCSDGDTITERNWFRLTTVSILVALKMFSEGEGMPKANRNIAACANIPLDELNRLEIDFLYLIDFDLFLEERDVVCWVTWMESLAYQAGMTTPLQAFMGVALPSGVASTVAFSASTLPDVGEEGCSQMQSPFLASGSSHALRGARAQLREGVRRRDSANLAARHCTGNTTELFGSSTPFSSSTMMDGDDSHIHDILTRSAVPFHSTSPSGSSLAERGCFSPVQEVTANFTGERLFSMIHSPAGQPLAGGALVNLKKLSQLGESPTAPPLPPTASPLNFMRRAAVQRAGCRTTDDAPLPVSSLQEAGSHPPAVETSADALSVAPSTETAASATGPFRKLVGRFREVVNLTSALARGRLNVLSPLDQDEEAPSSSNSPLSREFPGGSSDDPLRQCCTTNKADGPVPHPLADFPCPSGKGRNDDMDDEEEYPYGYEVNEDNWDDYDEEDYDYDDDDDDSPFNRQPPRYGRERRSKKYSSNSVTPFAVHASGTTGVQPFNVLLQPFFNFVVSIKKKTYIFSRAVYLFIVFHFKRSGSSGAAPFPPHLSVVLCYAFVLPATEFEIMPSFPLFSPLSPPLSFISFILLIWNAVIGSTEKRGFSTTKKKTNNDDGRETFGPEGIRPAAMPTRAPCGIPVRASDLEPEEKSSTVPRTILAKNPNSNPSALPDIGTCTNSMVLEGEDNNNPERNAIICTAAEPTDSAALFLAALTQASAAIDEDKDDEVEESAEEGQSSMSHSSTSSGHPSTSECASIAEDSSCSDATTTSEQELLSDVTGHSPISARLRLRIQRDQMMQRRKLQKKINPLKSSLRSAAEVRGKGKSLRNSSNTSTARSSLTSDQTIRTAPTDSLQSSPEKSTDDEKECPRPQPCRLHLYTIVERSQAILREALRQQPTSKSTEGKKPLDTIVTTKPSKTAPTNPKEMRRKSVSLGSPPIPPQTTHSKKPKIGDPNHLSTQYLVPELLTEEERRRTVTIVFDLDETLVNNRRRETLFRPHTFEVLKSLRQDHPHPVYKKSKVAAGNRLYDMAFKQFGLAPSASTNKQRSSGRSEAPEIPPVNELRVEIILWTASVETVGRPVVAKLDPNGNIFDQTIYRDFRWYRDVDYTKDLRRLGRDMDRVVIVENSIASVSLNRSNAILVSDFVSSLRDKELIITARILKEWMTAVRKALGLKGGSTGASLEPSYMPSLNASVVVRDADAKSGPQGKEQHKDPNTSSSSPVTPEKSSACSFDSRRSAGHVEHSGSPSPAPVDAADVDDIRVFLVNHRYIASTTNYLRMAHSSASRDVERSSSSGGQKKKLSSTLGSKAKQPEKPKKSSEPVWKRLYALAEKEINAADPAANIRNMQPPPPAQDLPPSAVSSPTKSAKKTAPNPPKGKNAPKKTVTGKAKNAPSSSSSSTDSTSTSSSREEASLLSKNSPLLCSYCLLRAIWFPNNFSSCDESNTEQHNEYLFQATRWQQDNLFASLLRLGENIDADACDAGAVTAGDSALSINLFPSLKNSSLFLYSRRDDHLKIKIEENAEVKYSMTATQAMQELLSILHGANEEYAANRKDPFLGSVQGYRSILEQGFLHTYILPVLPYSHKDTKNFGNRSMRYHSMRFSRCGVCVCVNALPACSTPQPIPFTWRSTFLYDRTRWVSLWSVFLCGGYPIRISYLLNYPTLRGVCRLAKEYRNWSFLKKLSPLEIARYRKEGGFLSPLVLLPPNYRTVLASRYEQLASPKNHITCALLFRVLEVSLGAHWGNSSTLEGVAARGREISQQLLEWMPLLFDRLAADSAERSHDGLKKMLMECRAINYRNSVDRRDMTVSSLRSSFLREMEKRYPAISGDLPLCGAVFSLTLDSRMDSGAFHRVRFASSARVCECWFNALLSCAPGLFSPQSPTTTLWVLHTLESIAASRPGGAMALQYAGQESGLERWSRWGIPTPTTLKGKSGTLKDHLLRAMNKTPTGRRDHVNISASNSIYPPLVPATVSTGAVADDGLNPLEVLSSARQSVIRIFRHFLNLSIREETRSYAVLPSSYTLLRFLHLVCYIGRVGPAISEDDDDILQCIRQEVLPKSHGGLRGYLRRMQVLYLSHSGAHGAVILLCAANRAMLDFLPPHREWEVVSGALLWSGLPYRDATRKLLIQGTPLTVTQDQLTSFGRGSLAWESLRCGLMLGPNNNLVREAVNHLLFLGLATLEDANHIGCFSTLRDAIQQLTEIQVMVSQNQIENKQQWIEEKTHRINSLNDVPADPERSWDEREPDDDPWSHVEPIFTVEEGDTFGEEVSEVTSEGSTTSPESVTSDMCIQQPPEPENLTAEDQKKHHDTEKLSLIVEAVSSVPKASRHIFLSLLDVIQWCTDTNTEDSGYIRLLQHWTRILQEETDLTGQRSRREAPVGQHESLLVSSSTVSSIIQVLLCSCPDIVLITTGVLLLYYRSLSRMDKRRKGEKEIFVTLPRYVEQALCRLFYHAGVTQRTTEEWLRRETAEYHPPPKERDAAGTRLSWLLKRVIPTEGNLSYCDTQFLLYVCASIAQRSLRTRHIGSDTHVSFYVSHFLYTSHSSDATRHSSLPALFPSLQVYARHPSRLRQEFRPLRRVRGSVMLTGDSGDVLAAAPNASVPLIQSSMTSFFWWKWTTPLLLKHHYHIKDKQKSKEEMPIYAVFASFIPLLRSLFMYLFVYLFMILLLCLEMNTAVITCGICFSTIKDAVQLQCGHNFCLECVQSTLVSSSEGEEQVAKCCLCGEDTLANDIDSLRNADLDAYLVMLGEGSNMKFMCQWCDLVPATLQCNQCAAAYCEDCSAALLTRCTQTGHEEYKAEFFCTECEELCCAYCLRVGPHLDHHNTDLQTAAIEAKKQISIDKPEAEKARKKLEKVAEDVKNIEGTYHDSYSRIDALITEKFNECRELLQNAENEIRAQLGSLSAGGDTMLMDSRSEFLDKVNSLTLALLKVESSDTDSKILRNKMLLNACMNNEFVPLTGKGFTLSVEKEIDLPDIAVFLDLHASDSAVPVGFSPAEPKKKRTSEGRIMTDLPHGHRSSIRDQMESPLNQRKLSDRNKAGERHTEHNNYNEMSDTSLDGRRRESVRQGRSRSQQMEGAMREDAYDTRDRYGARETGPTRRTLSERHRDTRDYDAYASHHGDKRLHSNSNRREPNSNRSEQTPLKDRTSRSRSGRRGDDTIQRDRGYPPGSSQKRSKSDDYRTPRVRDRCDDRNTIERGREKDRERDRGAESGSGLMIAVRPSEGAIGMTIEGQRTERLGTDQMNVALVVARKNGMKIAVQLIGGVIATENTIGMMIEGQRTERLGTDQMNVALVVANGMKIAVQLIGGVIATENTIGMMIEGQRTERLATGRTSVVGIATETERIFNTAGSRQPSGDYSVGGYEESSRSAGVPGTKGQKRRRCCPELDNPLRLTFPVDEDVEAVCRNDGIQFRCIARGNATTQIGVRSQETFLDVDRKYPEDNGMICWRIRLDIISDVFVGVVEQGSTAGSSGFFWKPGCSHVVDGKIGHYTAAMKNLPVCSTGDTVGFLYDAQDRTLRLFVNDEDCGIVVTDLTNNISACFILYPGETVTVLY